MFEPAYSSHAPFCAWAHMGRPVTESQSQVVYRFRFRRWDAIPPEDDSYVVFYTNCDGSRGPRAHCFHPECFDSKPADAPPLSRRLFKATRYMFTPPLSEERRRWRYIRDSLTEALMETSVWNSLPAELWDKIAGLLVRESAARYWRTLTYNIDTAQLSSVSLLEDVFASYVTIHGARYIQDLRNAKSESEANSGEDRLFRIFKARKGLAVQQVYVCWDCLGARNIVFSTDKLVAGGHNRYGTRPGISEDYVPGLAWSEHRLELYGKTETELKFRTDVSSLSSPLHANMI